MAKLHDLEVSQHLADCVEISEVDLDQEFYRIAADYAYWSAQFAAAYEVALVAKNRTKRVFAEVWELKRDAAIDADEGKITDKLIEARVTMDPTYCEAQDREAAADSERVRLRGIVDAVGIKKDALQSIGAKLRKEMDGDLAIMRRELQDRDQRRGSELG